MCVLMNEIRQKFVGLLLLPVLLVGLLLPFLGCSQSDSSQGLAGNSAETGSPELAGILLLDNGSPARLARVNCVPQTFDYSKGSALQEAFVTETDANGFYRFASVPGGVYSLEAIHGESGKRLLVQGLRVSNENLNLNDTLESPGFVTIGAAAEFADGTPVVVTAPGTTIFRMGVVENGMVLVDSLPSSVLNLRVDFGTGYTEIYDAVSVLPNDTAKVKMENVTLPKPLPMVSFVAPLALPKGARSSLEQLDDFPMVIRLDSTMLDFNTVAKHDGRWEAYRKTSDGLKSWLLPISQSLFDTVAKQAVFWVSVDSVNSTDSLELVFDTTKTPAYANDVFANSKLYAMVWHFDDGLFTDASEQGFYYYNQESFASEGAIGLGATFNGGYFRLRPYMVNDTNCVRNLNIDPVEGFDQSAWIKITDKDVEQTIFERGDSSYYLRYIPKVGLVSSLFHKASMIDGDTSSFYWRMIFEDQRITTGEWMFVAVTSFGDEANFYVNGNLSVVGEKMPWDGIRNEDTEFCFAHSCDASRYFTGNVDEFIMGGVARSKTWYYLSYINQRSTEFWPAFKSRFDGDSINNE